MCALRANKKRFESLAYVFLAVLVWSPIPLLLKRLIGGYSALHINFFVYLFAAIGAVAFLAVGGRWKRAFALSAREATLLVFTSFVGMVAYEILYAQSFAFLSASTANTINYFWPILMVLFASLLLGEAFSPRKAVALALGFSGVALILGADGYGISILGCALAFAGATSWALFNVLQKKFGFSGHSEVMLMLVVAFGFYSLFALISGGMPAFEAQDLPAFLFLGLFSGTLGTTLYIQALRLGDTAEIACVSFATPFMSLLLANSALGEPLRWEYFAALALFTSGMLLQLKKVSENEHLVVRNEHLMERNRAKR